MQLWIDLILKYSKAFKKYEFDVTEAANTPLFFNQKINRLNINPSLFSSSGRLNADAIRMIFDELVSHGTCKAFLIKRKRRMER